MLIIEGYGYGKTKPLLNHDDDYNIIDEIYLFGKDTNKAKYQFLIKSVNIRVLKIWKI